MALQFGPEQEDEFEEARDDLVRRFVSSRGDRHRWVARDVLEHKWHYLDGDLTSWSVDDVEALLFGIYPGKVILDPEHAGDVVDGFSDFLRFLSEESLLSEGTGQRLAQRVQEFRADFEAAMRDESLFSVGKRLTGEMLADGVDPLDRAAVERWGREFNERSFDERDQVLGPALERARGRADRSTSSARTRLRPVVLPSEGELRGAAESSVLARQIRDLVSFVGDGRKLTDKGNLNVADGKALATLLDTTDRFDFGHNGEIVRHVRSSKELRHLDLLFQVALAADFLVCPTKRSVAAGPASELLENEPLEAIGRLFEALLIEVGPTQHDHADDTYGFGWFAADADEALLQWTLDLYSETEAVEIEEITEDLWSTLLDEYELDDVEEYKLEVHQSLVEHAMRRGLHRLEDLGVVEQHDIECTKGSFGTTDESGGTVALAPLGVWLAHRVLARVADVPTVGSLREASADELLWRASDMPDDIAGAEVAVWVQAHGDDAAALLVEALPRAGETGRAIAFRALVHIGPGIAEEVARLADDPTLSAYALVWRVDTLVAGPEEMDADGDPERLVRVLHAVLVLWGPEATTAWLSPVAGTTGVVPALEATWRVRLPETELILATLGSFHSDKLVAKAARKTLFKFRSSGGATG